MKDSTSTCFRLGRAVVDLERRQVERDGTVQGLSPLDVAFLAVLLDADGHPVRRDTLYADVWRYHPNVRSRATSLLVSRLRGKIERDRRCPEHLLTVRGVGFRLVGVVPVTAERPFGSLGVPKSWDFKRLQGDLSEFMVAVRRGPPEQSLHLLTTLVDAAARGHLEVAAESILAVTDGMEALEHRLAGVALAARLLRAMGATKQALTMVDDRLISEIGNGRGAGVAYRECLGLRMQMLADGARYDEAMDAADALRGQASVASDRRALGLCDRVVAGIALRRGEPDKASQHWLDSIAHFRRSGCQRDLAWSLHQLGLLRVRQGLIDEAERLLEEAALVMAAAGFELDQAYVRTGWTLCLVWRGQLMESLAELDAIHAEIETRAAPFWLASVLAYRGRTCLLLGLLEQARNDLERACHLYGKIGHRVERREVTRYLGVHAHLCGRIDAAGAYYGVAAEGPLPREVAAELEVWRGLLTGACPTLPGDLTTSGLRRIDRRLSVQIAEAMSTNA